MKGYYRNAIDKNEKAILYDDTTGEDFDLNKTVLQDKIIDEQNHKDIIENKIGKGENQSSRIAVIALLAVTGIIMVSFIAVSIRKGVIHASSSEEVSQVVQNDNENSQNDNEEEKISDIDGKEQNLVEDDKKTTDTNDKDKDKNKVNNTEIEKTDVENNATVQSNQVNILNNKLDELAKEHSEVRPIINQKDKYPYSLLKDIVRNPEMISFALGYLSNINKTYSDTIDISQDVSNNVYGMPLLIQWDKRWGYYKYGNSVIGISGCGPTSLNMVYIHLTGDYSMNPIRMAKFCVNNGYVAPGVGTSWALMKEGAEKLGLMSSRISKSEQEMINQLQQGKPIIASMGPGIFTDRGHFIVFRGYENGYFYVNDPFCIEHTKTAWTYEQFGNQIKALWAYSY